MPRRRRESTEMLRRRATAAITLVAVFASLCGCARGQHAPEERSTAEGRRIFGELGCAGCHGPTGEGTRTAPSLEHLAAHWSEQTLVAYLEDPDQVKSETLRLQQLAEGYVVHMPPARPGDRATLHTLARYLLRDPR